VNAGWAPVLAQRLEVVGVYKWADGKVHCFYACGYDGAGLVTGSCRIGTFRHISGSRWHARSSAVPGIGNWEDAPAVLEDWFNPLRGADGVLRLAGNLNAGYNISCKEEDSTSYWSSLQRVLAAAEAAGRMP